MAAAMAAAAALAASAAVVAATAYAYVKKAGAGRQGRRGIKKAVKESRVSRDREGLP
jgi:hypothetical protein